MKIRRSLSLSFVVALGLVPSVLGCAVPTASEGDDGAAESESSALTLKGSTLDPALAVKTGGGAVDPLGTISPPDEADTPPPGAPLVMQKAVGAGWRTLHVKGSIPDAKTGELRSIDDDIIVLESEQAVDLAPLGDKTRAALKDAATMRALNDATAIARVAPGAVAPAPDTMAGAAAPEDDLITVVRVSGMQKLEASQDVGASPDGTAMFWSVCDDYDGTYSKSLSVDKTYGYHKGDEAGALTGHFDVTARLQGSATARIKYRAHTSVFAACEPVWVSFKRAEIEGWANVTSRGDLDAEFHKKWHYDHQIAKPKLFDDWFAVGPVPVHLRVFAPIEVGVDAEARASVKAKATLTGRASFDVVCTSSGCSGSRSGNLSWARDGEPTFEALARVKVTPWAQASLRAVLYGEDVGAYGQVGVRASLPADLWAYAGNTCGDANHDGQNEFVSGASLDLSAAVDVRAKAVVLGDEVGSWSWNLVNRHLWFGGVGSALDPIFYRDPPGDDYATTRMHGGMRPCWPYDNPVRYKITWGDGTATAFTGSAQSLFTKEHTFSGLRSATIRLDAISDTQGRSIDRSREGTYALFRWHTPPLNPLPGGGVFKM